MTDEVTTKPLVAKETQQQRAVRLITNELERLCDRLEEGTHMDPGQRLLLIQSIASAVALSTELTDKQWMKACDALAAVQNTSLTADHPWTGDLSMPENAQPRHVYHCHEQCPAYDGKDCSNTGSKAPCHYSNSWPTICTPWLDAVVQNMGVAYLAVWRD